MSQSAIRNVAIIAHVDHGKTTLVDQLLRQSGQFRPGELQGECIMDSNDLERERGITILAKNCAIQYTNRQGEHYHINILDTPGHADFGGEVERVLRMADGVLLVVDAFEGPMPQTRYVLSKALALGLRPIVVVNKMDRPNARPDEVLNEVFDLLVDLEAPDDALEFPAVYASGRDGWASSDAQVRTTDIHALFEAIIKHVPEPRFDAKAPLQMLVTTLDYSDYVGRIAIGRVFAGTLRNGQQIVSIDHAGELHNQRVIDLLQFDGLSRKQVKEIYAGDICAVVGLDPIDIGDTLATPESPVALPRVQVDLPTLHMTFRINDGPFVGQEGKFVTSRQIRSRLMKELQSNVALRVEEGLTADEFNVSGRGLLHLGILLENMRREGYEITVGKPRVIFKEENGKRLEPYEMLSVDTTETSVGSVMQIVGDRRGELKKMDGKGEMTHIEFIIPARGLIGLRNRLLTVSAGEAIVHHIFSHYGPVGADMPGRINGVMIASEAGSATAYAIEGLAERGLMFVKPGDAIYEGQIVGECNKDKDLVVNVVRVKKLNNIRAASKEATVTLKVPRSFSLELALEYIEDDELLELTPKSIRLRKRMLKESDRKRYSRQPVNA